MPAGAPNLVGLTQYDNQPNFFTDSVILSQGAGYGMVVGFGMFFALLTVLLVFADYRSRGGKHYNSEDFNTAGRTIKTGLIAVDVVSHWCERAPLHAHDEVIYHAGHGCCSGMPAHPPREDLQCCTRESTNSIGAPARS